MWIFVREVVVPSLFIVGFPIAVLQLNSPTANYLWNIKNLGNFSSWTYVTLFTVWAVISLKIPAKLYYGRPTSFGFTPCYKANGFLYYMLSFLMFLLLDNYVNNFSTEIYNNMTEIIASLNICGFVFCIYLWFTGKLNPQSNENIESKPMIFEFYRGMETHPSVWQMDVKQLIICRIGMMAWQFLLWVFFSVSLINPGWNWGLAVNVFLQTAYIAKFFWSETWYFSTLDVIHDRAGFYLCWGCLALLPSFFTFNTYYFIKNPPNIISSTAVWLLSVGLFLIFMEYIIDHEKEVFKESNGRFTCLYKKPRFIEAEIRGSKGLQKSRLLVSGFWGMARHLNYTCELLIALTWCLPGYNKGISPFWYFIFMFSLIIHRIFRDEDRCSHKYGPAWVKYCEQVKYRLIPRIF